jgi:hypothetical protein
MSLLDPPAFKESKSRALPFTIAALSIVAVILLWWTFRFFPETHVAKGFLDAVVAGDLPKAYEIWKPGPSYKMKDFEADWGPTGYYGPVKSYEIRRAVSRPNSSGIAITVEVSPFTPMPTINEVEKSQKTKTIDLWVEKKDKSISFAP